MRVHQARSRPPPGLEETVPTTPPRRGRPRRETRRHGAQRAPDLDVERALAAAPEHDLRLVVERARRHADRKSARIEIERAAGVERPRRGRSADDKPELGECQTSTRLWGGPVEHRFEHFCRAAQDRRRPQSSAIRPGRHHKAARPAPSPAGPSLDGGSAPKAMPQAMRAPSPPRRMKRAAGGELLG